MALVPGVRYDVFVSYAYVDNVSPDAGPEGWVDKFYRALVGRLRKNAGKGVAIWRDLKVQGNDYFNETIAQAARDSALFLPIVSRNWVQSPWCRSELVEFCRAHSPRIDTPLGPQSRLFPLFIPPSAKALPDPLASLIGYRFYDMAPEQQEDLYRQTNEADDDQRYWKRLDDLAIEIAETINNLTGPAGQAAAHSASGPAQAHPASAGPEVTVYLAEVTDDLDGRRDEIRRFLVHELGARVVPAGRLPLAAAEAEGAIGQNIRESQLSIHLLGAFYGKRPENEARSYPHLQWELAGQFAANQPAFRRLVWAPRTVSPATVVDVDQQQFLAGVESEVLRTDFEAAKDAIAVAVRALRPAPVPAAIPPDMVYVVCKAEDRRAAEWLANECGRRAYDVTIGEIPDDEGPVTREHRALGREHRRYLRISDGVVVVFGQVPLVWVREQVTRARSTAVQRRRRPLRVLAVCETPPADKPPLGLKWQGLLVIDCRRGLDVTQVDPLGSLFTALTRRAENG